MTLTVLPTLIKLFTEISTVGVQERAPLVFASLVSNSEYLQRAAMEGDGIKKLASLVHGIGIFGVSPLIEEDEKRRREEVSLHGGLACGTGNLTSGHGSGFSMSRDPITGSLGFESSKSEKLPPSFTEESSLEEEERGVYAERVKEVKSHLLFFCGIGKGNGRQIFFFPIQIQTTTILYPSFLFFF